MGEVALFCTFIIFQVLYGCIPRPPVNPSSTEEATISKSTTATMNVQEECVTVEINPGRKCVFPFQYQNKEHNECLTFHGKYWCGLSYKYDKQEWGYCNQAVCPPTRVVAQEEATNEGPTVATPATAIIPSTTTTSMPVECLTVQRNPGRKCIFPFQYQNKEHDECLPYKGKYWCGLTFKYDGRQWGYCDQMVCPPTKEAEVVPTGAPTTTTTSQTNTTTTGTKPCGSLRGPDNINELLAPNSFDAKIKCKSSSCYLREDAICFEKLAPTLIFGFGFSEIEVVFKWKDLKNFFVKDKNFNVMLADSKFSFWMYDELVIITHGWGDDDINDCQSHWTSNMARDIRRQNRQASTIVLCWNSKPAPDFSKHTRDGIICGVGSTSVLKWTYYRIASSTAKVGEFLAEIIKSVRDKNTNILIHGIGHSLGAHIMGNIYNFGGEKLNRISGMDPAGPCFEKTDNDIQLADIKQFAKHWGLNSMDALLVDNIHTDGEKFGTYLSMGHLDFFAGEVDAEGFAKPDSQPTCWQHGIACKHSIAKKYYLRSITEKDNFVTAYPMGSESSKFELKADKAYYTKAGFHIEQDNLGQPTPERRMFLPMFKHMTDNSNFAAVCDKINLKEKYHHYCNSIQANKP